MRKLVGTRFSLHGIFRSFGALARVAVLGLATAWLASAPASAQAPAPFNCPGGSVQRISGVAVQTGPCTIRGDLTLSGTAVLVIDRSEFVLDGNLRLRDDARLIVQDSIFTLDQDFVLQHTIEARGRSHVEFIGSVLSTNRSTPGASFAAQYVGFDQSVLRVRWSQMLLPDSWLLADVHDQATVHTSDSKNFPSEIYPHGGATVLIEGPGADHRVWLEFLPDSHAVLSAIPDPTSPFDFAFGRETPGVVGVGWQVRVIDGVATFGIASHPRSDLTLERNAGPVSIGYFVTDATATEPLAGIHPGLRNATLTHHGRTLRLVDANLEGFAWQLYASDQSATPGTIPIADSVLNEIAALEGGRFSVTNTIFQWAVIAALGARSAIDITGSTINSQSIVAAKDAVIHIDSSQIFGASIEARDDSVILLTNSTLGHNVCHALCLPVCPSFADGGCNWFLDPDAPVSLRAADRAMIVALGIDALAGPIAPGASHAFTGDAVAVTAAGNSTEVDYDLRWKRVADGAEGTLATGARGPKRGESLGTLATAGMPAGDYFAILALRIGTAPAGTVVRPFRIGAP